jgi:RHS repeat-associated protein
LKQAVTGKHSEPRKSGIHLAAAVFDRARSASIRLRRPVLGTAVSSALVVLALCATASAAECTDTWTGSAEGSWATASNWSAGHVPNEGDVACIGSGKTAKVSSGTNQAAIVQGEGGLVISGGSLELKRSPSEGESTISTLTVSGSGTLKGIGKLSVSKTLSWTGGTMRGTGTTVLSAEATGSMSGGVFLNERTLVNHGALSLSSSFLSMSNDSRIENPGTFTANTESTEGIVHPTGAAPLIVNTGTIRKTSGSGSTLIKVGLENRGTVKAETGTLSFPTSEPLTLVTGSALEGSIKLSGPSVSAQSFTMPSGTLTLASGTLTVETGCTAAVSGIAMTGGTLKGGGALTASGAVNWSGGTMSGTGSTTLLSEAVGSLSNAFLSERTLINKGSLSLVSGFLSMPNGSRLENSGTFTVNTESTEGIVHNTGAAPLIVNTGTMRKSSGSGATKIKVALQNSGGLVAETGSIVFPTAAEPVTLGAKSVLAGDIKLEGPAVTAQSFGMPSGTLTLQSGSLSVESGYTASAAGFTQTGGTLKGAGTLEVSNNLNWTGGSMAGTGYTEILASGSGTVSNVSINERTLINGGSLSLSGAYLMMREAAILENTGTLTVNAEGEETGIIHPYAEPGALLVNSGTVRKSSGSGHTLIEANLANSGGTVRAETGTLVFEDSQTTLLFTGSALVGSVKFQGPDIIAGNVASSGGTLTIGGMSSLEIGTGSTVQAADLVVNGPVEGAGNLKISSNLTWEGGEMSGSGRTILAAGASGSVSETRLDERTFVNEGTMTLPTRYLQLRDAATFENQGTFNANTEGFELGIVQGGTGANPLFLNTGVFQKTAGTGTTEVEPPFNNSGVIREQSGHLEITNPVKTARTNKFGNRSCSGDPVECATGDFTETQNDVAIGGRGVGLVLTRTYSAQSAAAATSPGAFGYGWSATFSDRLTIEESGAKVTVVRGDGSTIPFTRTSGTAYAGPTWSKETLSGSSEAGYTFTTVDQTAYCFSGGGRLESVVDRNGNATTLAYDEAGRLKAITDPAGRQLAFAYNGGGQVESVTDPMGHVVKYAYEGGNLTAVTPPGEESPRWQFKYDASHRITEVIDGRGGKTTNEYDGSSRVVSQTDPAERTLTFKYEPFHTTVTNKATGAVTDKWFTSNNEPFSITYGYGTPLATTRSFAYNAAGQLVRETDGNGNATIFGYDEAGNRASERDALGHETKWTYNATHDVISATTPRGEPTTIERDSRGNVEVISRPAPGETTQTTTFAYDEYGQLESVTDPLERTWSFGYDAYGDRTSETDPLGHTRTLGYDKGSRLISVVSPRGNAEGVEPAEYETTVERDAQGRPLKVTDPLGHATEYAYDGNGNLASLTDAKGHTTNYTYDGADEETKVEKPNGAILETAYDGAGEITSQTDANELTTTYVRNVLEQPVETIDPLGRKTIQQFDEAGNLVATIDPAERETSYSYDAADRLTAIDYSEEATADAGFEYDADGNLTAMADGTGESSLAYDQLGRLTSSEDGHGEVIEFSYDLAEQQIGIVYPNGKEVSRSYDAAGRLESLSDWLGGTTGFAYDADSNLKSITFPTASGNVDEYAYDRASRMSEAKFKKGSETLASLSYVRDPIGQVETEARIGLPGPKELSYGYDQNNRLIDAGAEGFEYDAADNLTKGIGSTNSYDAASQLETGTGLTYTYDKLGERTKATPASGPATSYGYDQAGSLISVTRPKEGEVPAIAEVMSYDATGLLASKTRGLVTRHLAWDVSSSLALLLDDGETSYLYGPGGLPVEQINEGEPTYLHHDQLGSTRLLSGEGGETTAAFSYTPYGGLEGSTGTQTTPLGFAGQYTDAETGFQYLRARFYDPATGQFLTRDPVEDLTREPYSYALDNPVRNVDPAGLFPIAIPVPIECFGGPWACAGAGAGIACASLAPCRDAAAEAANELVDLFDGEDTGEASSSADENEPCLEPPVDPWELETEIGHRGDQQTKDEQFLDKLGTSAGSNPETPYGNGPRWNRLAALIARLIAGISRHGE